MGLQANPERKIARRSDRAGRELIQNLNGIIPHFDCQYETICMNLYSE